MKRLWWRVRLFVLLNWFRYTPRKLWNVVETWKWTKDPWLDMYEWGLSPMEALREDWSYGD